MLVSNNHSNLLLKSVLLQKVRFDNINWKDHFIEATCEFNKIIDFERTRIKHIILLD